MKLAEPLPDMEMSKGEALSDDTTWVCRQPPSQAGPSVLNPNQYHQAFPLSWPLSPQPQSGSTGLSPESNSVQTRPEAIDKSNSHLHGDLRGGDLDGGFAR